MMKFFNQQLFYEVQPPCEFSRKLIISHCILSAYSQGSKNVNIFDIGLSCAGTFLFNNSHWSKDKIQIIHNPLLVAITWSILSII